MVTFPMFAPFRCAAALALCIGGCSAAKHDEKSREFSGIWLYEFEGSTFVEGATRVPHKRPNYREHSWLDLEPEKLIPFSELNADHRDLHDCYEVRPFALKFIGHEENRPYGSGHGGLWRSEIKVDRMISAERLGVPFCYDS